MFAGDIHRQWISELRRQHASDRLIDDHELNPCPALYYWETPVAGRLSCVISSPRDR